MTPREFFDLRVNLLLGKNNSFQVFFHRNRTKINSDIRNAANDDNNLNAILAELEFADFTLQNPRLELNYYRTNTTRTPDFIITGDGTRFYAEVKRLCLTSLEQRFFEIEQRLERALGAVPSGLSVNMKVDHLNICRYSSWEEFITDFDSKCSSVALELHALVTRMDRELNDDQTSDYMRVGDLADMVSVFVSKPARKADKTSTDFSIGLYPIFYKQNERLKLIDAIIDNIDQLQAGAPNILFVRSENDTYETGDARAAIQEFILNPRSDDLTILESKLNKRGMNHERFDTALKRLSTFQFRSNWGNNVEQRTYQWINPTADYPLPNWINDHLRTAS